MPDDGAVAVAEAPVEAVSTPESVGAEPVESTPEGHQADDKQDGRRQPDALRKRIADLRKQADGIADPAEKQRLLADAKELNNRVGKVAAYEQTFPTVREARETKALVESFGGKDGLTNLQTTLTNIQQVDQMLEQGNPAIVGKLWDEAKDGMVKLAPAIFAEMEKRNPQEYAKAVAPHAVRFFDASGFPEAFDQMVGLFAGGKTDEGKALAQKIAQWFSGQRQAGGAAEKTPDPETERWRKEAEEARTRETQQATDRAYQDVVSHAGPVIDKYLKPIVAKLGLSKEQYEALREDTWDHLQSTRNADGTYKTVANAKYRQGVQQATEYIKGETEARAEAAARARANFWYGHQLKNGAVRAKPATAAPVTANVTKGKMPSPQEIDYSPKGVAAVKKAGLWDQRRHKDMADVIMDGIAPLKAGGIRRW